MPLPEGGQQKPERRVWSLLSVRRGRPHDRGGSHRPPLSVPFSLGTKNTHAGSRTANLISSRLTAPPQAASIVKSASSGVASPQDVGFLGGFEDGGAASERGDPQASRGIRPTTMRRPIMAALSA